MSTEENLPANGETKPAKPELPKPTTTGKTWTLRPSANEPANPGPPGKAIKPPKPVVPSLFRMVDWVTMLITTVLVFIGYLLTMAPEVTLQDSGELATGSFYAGVPHPPGYPLWTIFTYLFTVLVPVANVAYRVSIGSAVAGSLACGMLALLVSRGSSMIIEGVEDFKGMARKAENSICIVSGFVAGALLAYNGYMWSQSVIVEVYPFSVLSLMGVMTLILRWMYAPHQRGYLYWAWFLFGVCFTNHQTLIVAAMGIEGAILAGQPKLGRDLLLGNTLLYILGLFVIYGGYMGAFKPNDMVLNLFHIVGVLSILGCGWLTLTTRKLGTELLPVVFMFALWVVGAAFYLYEPITSMTNPPMNWCYTRTVDGWIHALTRGQYNKANPSDIFHAPGRFITQLGMYGEWATDEFNLVNLALAIIPILLFFKLARRERAWLTGLASIWFCLAIVLLILLNPEPDRASRELNKVFFSASFTIIALFIGYGLTLTASYLTMQYQRARSWVLPGAGITVVLALVTLYLANDQLFGGIADGGGLIYGIKQSFAPNQYALPIHAGMILTALTLGFVLLLAISKTKAPLGIVLGIFLFLPANSIMSHWSDNEERGHWFGYWFGHDMFTPPLVGSDGKLTYDPAERKKALAGTNAAMVYPEMTRDAILFGGTDPGRFCPTYMIFCDSQIPHDKQPEQDQHFDRRDVYIITQNALADPPYLEYIRAQYNRSEQKDPPFFQELLRFPGEKEQNYKTNFLASLANRLLDQPLTEMGRKIEERRRKEGLYPLKEIHTPTAEDLQNYTGMYMQDVQQRYSHDLNFPNEPKQMRPMEDVKQVDGRISIQGQASVMAINGLLTKVIFDRNPTNEFFVEESFPLDWMFPYLTPFGMIMKINRQPLEELSDEVLKRDHEFWSHYSERFIGNWITYDTKLKDIADFVEKVYLRRDFNGFKGDRKFIRDDDAQKAFSKLRSAIGGVYIWRLDHARSVPEQEKVVREMDFAFKQAFCMCPFSPEVVSRYVPVLMRLGRLDDALIVAGTCHKMDPNNAGIEGLYNNLLKFKKSNPGGMAQQPLAPAQPQPNLAQLQTVAATMEQTAKEKPDDFQNLFNLATVYMQMKNGEKAMQTLDRVLTNSHADEQVIVFLAQNYLRIGNLSRMEPTLERLTQLDPHSPEAWYDLAGIKVSTGRTQDALKALKQCFVENAARLAKNPKAPNMLLTNRMDDRFKSLRGLPEYQAMVK